MKFLTLSSWRTLEAGISIISDVQLGPTTFIFPQHVCLLVTLCMGERRLLKKTTSYCPNSQGLLSDCSVPSITAMSYFSWHILNSKQCQTLYLCNYVFEYMSIPNFTVALDVFFVCLLAGTLCLSYYPHQTVLFSPSLCLQKNICSSYFYYYFTWHNPKVYKKLPNQNKKYFNANYSVCPFIF